MGVPCRVGELVESADVDQQNFDRLQGNRDPRQLEDLAVDFLGALRRHADQAAGRRDLTQLVFCTLRSTRKFANLQAEPRVALLVDDRDNVETDLQEAAAATVLGRAEEIVGAERQREVARFVARHPAMADFVSSPGCALMGVAVEAYYLVTRFQNVIEIYPDHGDLRTADPQAR